MKYRFCTRCPADRGSRGGLKQRRCRTSRWSGGAGASPPPPSLPVHLSLLPPMAPFPPVPANAAHLPPSPFPSPSVLPDSPRPHSDTSWEDDWSAKDDDLLLSLKCNERLRPSWRYIAKKMQRPESQIRARWAELLELQRLATS